MNRKLAAIKATQAYCTLARKLWPRCVRYVCSFLVFLHFVVATDAHNVWFIA